MLTDLTNAARFLKHIFFPTGRLYEIGIHISCPDKDFVWIRPFIQYIVLFTLCTTRAQELLRFERVSNLSFISNIK